MFEFAIGLINKAIENDPFIVGVSVFQKNCWKTVRLRETWTIRTLPWMVEALPINLSPSQCFHSANFSGTESASDSS